MSKIDPGLYQFCTPRQEEILKAIESAGSTYKAAAELDIHRGYVQSVLNRVRMKAARMGHSPDHDMTRQVPEGYHIRGVSSLYNKDGALAAQWVKSNIDRDHTQQMLEAMVEGFRAELPQYGPAPKPRAKRDDLMVGYPIGDHHFGGLVWAAEAGGDWDLEIAQKSLLSAMACLVQASMPASSSLIAVLGDYFHYDGMQALTPTSGNLLDTDTRYPKMVRIGIMCLRGIIDMALRRHAQVHVIVEVGNHDLASSIFLMECIRVAYENEPRVSVDTSPRQFHYHRFGKNLIGTYHGHKVKPVDLPLIMATDQPEDWGATEHRTWWSGHIHHKHVHDIQGCTVESFRVLPPGDEYAYNLGYRSKREMNAITYHQEHGEVGRSKVNPKMFEEQT